MFPKWMTLFFLLFLLRFVTIVIGLVLAGTSARLHIISTCLTEMIFFSHGFLFSRSRTRDECSEGTVSCPAWKDTLDKGQPPPSMIGYYRARYNLIQLQLLLLLAVMNQKRARIFFVVQIKLTERGNDGQLHYTRLASIWRQHLATQVILQG